MLVLCGFSVSNYFNKVKMVLLEKGVVFTQERVGAGQQDEATLGSSPLGKIPFIRTERGALCESQAIADYLEAAYPHPPLMPADPWAAAKVRELITFIDLHVELVARELYGKAFFGGDISDANADRVRKLLTKNIAGFKRLAKFAPYVGGDMFTLADCAARLVRSYCLVTNAPSSATTVLRYLLQAACELSRIVLPKYPVRRTDHGMAYSIHCGRSWCASGRVDCRG